MEPLVDFPSPWYEMLFATVGSSKFVMLKKSEFVFGSVKSSRERIRMVFLERLMMFEEEQEEGKFNMVVWFFVFDNN